MKEFVVKLPIGFLSLMCGIKNDLVTGEDEVGIAHGLLNFNYKLFIGKYVIDYSFPNVVVIDEFGLSSDENMLNVAPMFGPVKSPCSQGSVGNH